MENARRHSVSTTKEKEEADISCSCIIITYKVEIAGSASLGLGNEAASWNFVNAGKSRVPAGNLWRDLSPLFHDYPFDADYEMGSLWVNSKVANVARNVVRSQLGVKFFLPR